jgi:peptide subunit release factor 1 (eRF1)
MYARGSPVQPTKRETPTADIQFVSARLFFMLAKRHDHHGFVIMPRQQAKQLYATTTGAI